MKSQSQHGGARPGAGRKPGSVSAVKKEMADLAQDHAPDALGTLVRIANDATAPAAAQVTAAVAILDRAYGKPRQAMEIGGKDGGPLTVEIIRFGDIADRKGE